MHGLAPSKMPWSLRPEGLQLVSSAQRAGNWATQTFISSERAKPLMSQSLAFLRFQSCTPQPETIKRRPELCDHEPRSPPRELALELYRQCDVSPSKIGNVNHSRNLGPIPVLACGAWRELAVGLAIVDKAFLGWI